MYSYLSAVGATGDFMYKQQAVIMTRKSRLSGVSSRMDHGSQKNEPLSAVPYCLGLKESRSRQLRHLTVRLLSEVGVTGVLD